jgi:RNA polymerase sigma factor (sigma-70 family)
MLKSNDQVVLDGIRQGDRVLLAELYRDMMPSIKRLAGSVGLGTDDAKDIFQDAIVVVFEKVSQPGFKLTSQFSTYFYGICRNILGNRLKKKSNRDVTLPDDLKYREDEHAGAQSILEDAERHRLFHRAFGKLGEDCRKLLEMAFEDVPPETIMTALNIKSNDYFRRRKYLCKEKLTQLVQDDPAYKELKKQD